MTDERTLIFEDLLKIVFKCDVAELNRIILILRDARLLYGQDVYAGSLTALMFDWEGQEGSYEPIREVYHAIIKNVVGNLIDYKDFDFNTYELLDEFNYDDPTWRFSLEDFESLSVPLRKKDEITQKLNEFLDFTNH